MSGAQSFEGPDAGHGETVELVPEAAIELSASGRVVAANDLAAALFGCARRELVGRAAASLVPEAALLDDAHARARVEARRASGVPVLVDVSVRRYAAAGEERVLCVLREVNHGALADEAQQYFDVAFEHAPIGMALFNCDGEYVRVNAALCAMLGRPASELIGRRDQELTHTDDRQADVDAAWEILAGARSTHQCEKRFVRPDGSIVWTLANLTFLRDRAGRPLSWVGQFQDITAHRRAADALRESEERFRLAFAHAPIGIALVSPEGRWLRVNRALCEMLGYGEAQLLRSTFQAITHPDDLGSDLAHVRRLLTGEIDRYEIEKRYRRGDGTTVWSMLSVSLVRDPDGEPLYFVSQIQDIDARKRAERELEHLAAHDPLTGALNRRAWDRELAAAIEHDDRTGERLALILLDLNGFKHVNDTYGHAAGDRVLKLAAGAWQEHLRDTDRLARLGGDEFAVLLRGSSASHVTRIARRLRDSLTHPGGCAIGVAVRGSDEPAKALIARADDALYADKPRDGAAVPAGRLAVDARESRER